MVLRVASWGTGNTGRLALRGILQHPDLELVGVRVHDPAKIGQDAGTLAGLAPTGVAATDDVAAIRALAPDCLAYLGNGIGRADLAVAEICEFLRAGVNVVTTSLNSFVYPPAAPAAPRRDIEEACAAGGASFFGNGADPGFGSDLIPLALLSLMDDIESVRIQEIVNYAYYDQAFVMHEVFGFGQPAGFRGPLFDSGWLTESWGGVVTQLADRLGITLDSIDETHETATVDHDVETAFGVVAAGTTAAIRFEVRGLVAGKPVLVVEHATRVAADAAPQWARWAGEANGYRIIIEGRPRVVCELNLADEHGGDGGLIATAMRVVNAIPAVCAAPAGLLDATDVPLTVGANVRFR